VRLQTCTNRCGSLDIMLYHQLGPAACKVTAPDFISCPIPSSVGQAPQHTCWRLHHRPQVLCLSSYLQDLQHHPRNGWSLLGLLQVAQAAGSPDQSDLKQQWRSAWADAEVHISSSCPALAEPYTAA
jgi:hypothetical protein